MNQQTPSPNARPIPPYRGSGQLSWQRVARRIRVPLGFLTAIVFLIEVARRQPHPIAIAWSLALVLPGLALRAAASGTVKKNRELAVTGPYAYTRNPLYLGSLLIGVGFGVAARSWWVGVALIVMFFAIYIPVIRDEETFLRQKFPEFEDYARRVPRMFPRITAHSPTNDEPAGFSTDLYLKHREYNALLGAIAMLAALALKMEFFR